MDKPEADIKFQRGAISGFGFFLFISALSNDMVRNPIIDFPQFCMRLELCWFHVWDF